MNTYGYARILLGRQIYVRYVDPQMFYNIAYAYYICLSLIYDIF